MEIQDQIGRRLEYSETPKRIVSLVPSQTELLVDLGLKDKLVGLTKFCVHPENIRQEKSIVGGTKKVKIDKIKALNPDIILCNKEENTKELVDELMEIAPVHVSDINSLAEAYTMIAQYGELFSAEAKAQEIIASIQKEHNEFQAFIKNKKPKKVVYFIWKDPWMVAGNKTFIHVLLKECGFENMYANLNRYPEINLKKWKEIDYVLLSSEPFPFAEKHKVFFKDFVAEEKIKLVDGEYFSWYGSRLLGSFKYFKTLWEAL